MESRSKRGLELCCAQPFMNIYPQARRLLISAHSYLTKIELETDYKSAIRCL
jgi:hypothetical protein